MLLTVNHAAFSYDSSHMILKNITFQLDKKSLVGILGPNGIGKSTLLKIIAGLINPSSGYIEVFHEKMNNLKDFSKYRSDIGYLPQDVTNHFLCPTVIEDVIFSLRAKGISKEDALNQGKQILQELQISHLENRVIFDLSGGEQKIVALAGLLILKPKILLLDEPTNALDEQSEKRIVEILNSIKKSMIIVSHHRSFIESLTSTVYRLDCGSLEN